MKSGIELIAAEAKVIGAEFDETGALVIRLQMPLPINKIRVNLVVVKS